MEKNKRNELHYLFSYIFRQIAKSLNVNFETFCQDENFSDLFEEKN